MSLTTAASFASLASSTATAALSSQNLVYILPSTCPEKSRSGKCHAKMIESVAVAPAATVVLTATAPLAASTLLTAPSENVPFAANAAYSAAGSGPLANEASTPSAGTARIVISPIDGPVASGFVERVSEPESRRHPCSDLTPQYEPTEWNVSGTSGFNAHLSTCHSQLWHDAAATHAFMQPM